MSAIPYRPDIDGLRAVAVLAVVLYHAFPAIVPGGFVGVDIFFVISGYLITTIITRDIRAGAFSLKSFWMRRIRRIAPAMAVMILTVLGICSAFYVSRDAVSVSWQAISQAFLTSNFYYYGTAGYFDAGTVSRPLLHTWSLAVEEQFYLFFPLLVIFLWRTGGGNSFVKGGIAVAAMISFALSVWMVHRDQDMAFYLLPFRIWELMIGAILVFMPSLSSVREREFYGWAGLIMVAVGVFGLNDQIPFPGAAALIPCLGAALYLFANQGGAVTSGRALSFRPAAFTGRVSYSFYLWHWPVLIIPAYFAPELHTDFMRAGLVILSFAIAVLSWRYVEQPFRDTARMKPKTVMICFAVSTIAICILALTIIIKERRDAAILQDVLRMDVPVTDDNPYRNRCMGRTPAQILSGDMCQTNPESNIAPTFLVWGDSYADTDSPAFFDVSKDQAVNGYVVFKASCGPIVGLLSDQSEDTEACHDYNDAVMEFIQSSGIEKVFLVSNWGDWFQITRFRFDDLDWYKNYEEQFDGQVVAGAQRTIDTILQTGAQVYVLLEQPKFTYNIQRRMAIEEKYGIGKGKAYINESDYLAVREHGMNSLMTYNRNNEKVVFIDPAHVFCRDGKCSGTKDGKALYIDSMHLSVHGANLLKPLFEPYMKEGR